MTIHPKSLFGWESNPLFPTNPVAAWLHIAYDPTFVRAVYDDDNLYLSIVALTAPRKDGKLKPIEKDHVLFRFDPYARGRHAVSMTFSSKGRIHQYDSHDTWYFDHAWSIRSKNATLTNKDAKSLPVEEAAMWKRIGEGVTGWLARTLALHVAFRREWRADEPVTYFTLAMYATLFARRRSLRHGTCSVQFFQGGFVHAT